MCTLLNLIFQFLKLQIIRTFLFVTLLGFPFRVLPICIYVLFEEIDVELFLTHINKNMFCVHACYWVSRRLWTISDCYVSSLGLSVFFNVILSPGWLEQSALTRTMSQHIFWIYATAPMFWSLKVSHIVYHSSISWYIVMSFNWTHRNTKAYSYFSDINLHVSVGRCL